MPTDSLKVATIGGGNAVFSTSAVACSEIETAY